MSSLSRAQFLRGDWSGTKPELKPPWALPEPEFTEACNGCGDCVSACPQHIISLSARKRPTLDFSSTGCTFCGDCVAACEPAALKRPTNAVHPPWALGARIGDDCLAMNGTTCLLCIEACEEDAILARPALGGRTIMRTSDDCTGCGMCVNVCPVNAIAVTHGDRSAERREAPS